MVLGILTLVFAAIFIVFILYNCAVLISEDVEGYYNFFITAFLFLMVCWMGVIGIVMIANR